MIQQYQYTTTQKYNFPQTLEDLQLPQRFIELSLTSLKNIDGNNLKPSRMILHELNDESPEHDPLIFLNNSITLKSVPLKPLPNDTTIVAVDVSSITVGETETGVLCALRGAIVWRENKQYRVLSLGPFPFHITEENKKEIYNLLRQYYFKIQEASPPSLVNMQTRMGSLLERWLQMGLSCSLHDGVILWDGSLTAGTIDSPTNVMSQLLEIARNRFNTVLAFSKTTNLRLFGSRLTDLVWRSQPPCLVEINGFPSYNSGPMRFLGNIYVAKLTDGNCAFRLDVDGGVTKERGIEAIQRLLGNDLVFQSYPETLRLAHIFSTFTANEVIGIQHFIAKKCGLKIVTRPNMRRLLFGPFGKGAEG